MSHSFNSPDGVLVEGASINTSQNLVGPNNQVSPFSLNAQQELIGPSGQTGYFLDANNNILGPNGKTGMFVDSLGVIQKGPGGY